MNVTIEQQPLTYPSQVQIQNPNQQPNTIYASAPPPSTSVQQHDFVMKHTQATLGLGATQVFCGCAVIVLEIIGLLFATCNSTFTAGTGIFSGFFFITAGALAIASAKRNKRSLVSGTMGMSIFCAAFSAFCCNFLWSLEISLNYIRFDEHLLEKGNYYNNYITNKIISSCGNYGITTVTGVTALCLIFSNVEIFIAIAQSAVTCKILCSSKNGCCCQCCQGCQCCGCCCQSTMEHNQQQQVVVFGTQSGRLEPVMMQNVSYQPIIGQNVMPVYNMPNIAQTTGLPTGNYQMYQQQVAPPGLYKFQMQPQNQFNGENQLIAVTSNIQASSEDQPPPQYEINHACIDKNM